MGPLREEDGEDGDNDEEVAKLPNVRENAL
jgi:hypothetical protein